MPTALLALGVIVAAVISTCVTLLLTADAEPVRDLALLGSIVGVLAGIALSTYRALSHALIHELALMQGRLDRVEESTERMVGVERDVLHAVRSSSRLN